MVTKKYYVGALVLAVVLLSLSFAIAQFYDNAKFDAVQRSVREFTTESEETRLLLYYGEVFTENKQDFCQALEVNSRKRMDRGYELVNRLRDFERANLLSDYEQVRKQYYLNNYELWLQRTVEKRNCGGSNFTLALFFTETLTTCPDCIVQGEILDQLRGSCTNLQIITLASDLDIAPIELAKKKFGAAGVPAIVVNNQKTLLGVKKREELGRELGCAG